MKSQMSGFHVVRKTISRVADNPHIILAEYVAYFRLLKK